MLIDQERDRKSIILDILGIKPFKGAEEIFDKKLNKLSNKTIDLENIV